MKTILLFAVLLLLQISSESQIYKTKQPLLFKGQVYDVLLNLYKDTNNGDKQTISINFYMVCTDKNNSKNLETAGGVGHAKSTYISIDDTKDFEYLRGGSETKKDGLCKLVKCNANISDDKIEITLNDTIGLDKVKLTLYRPRPALVAMEESDYMPASYMDDQYVNYMKSTASADKDFSSIKSSGLSSNYMPQYAGNIDSKEFPTNKDLRSVLDQNGDFVFKLTMDLYLDLIRFKANMCDYDAGKITTFLSTHDLNYLGYSRDEVKLTAKIKACTELVKEACRRINLGDIFYKDYVIQPDKVNVSSEYSLISLNDKDDYYGAKKIKGEADAFYKTNGLNIYLTNWQSLKELNLHEAQLQPFFTKAAVHSKPVMLRVYFLVQPYAVYSPEGDFKGVTAYSLKAIVYNACAREPLLTSDNTYLTNIPDSVVKRCYLSGSKFLNNYMKKQDWLTTASNVAPLYDNNFDELGSWKQSFGDCEIAYNYLSCKIKKLETNDRMLVVRMMTNYNTTFQPGYEVTFTNKANGAAFKAPLTETTITLTGKKGGYYNLFVKIPAATYDKMMKSGVDNIEFQCNGEPIYLIPHDYFYYNPNDVLSHDIEKVQADFVGDSSQKLMTILKKGL